MKIKVTDTHVVFGGSTLHEPKQARSHVHYNYSTTKCYKNIGFRLVRITKGRG